MQKGFRGWHFFKKKKNSSFGLWEETRVVEDLGLNPSTGWTFFTLICYKNCNVCLKKTENKLKRCHRWAILLQTG